MGCLEESPSPFRVQGVGFSLLLVLLGWASACRSLAVVAGPRAETCCSLAAGHGDTLKEVQRKNKQLRVQLNKTPWPILQCFSSNGQSYSLPLRAKSKDLSRLPSESRLAYLSGFFDGDGCVSPTSRLSGCRLQVVQSFDQAEVLMRFYETFGGSIVRLNGGRGLKKPSLVWCAGGHSARRAVQLLAAHSITKRKQLLLAAQWPEAKSHRERSKAELRTLKEYDSAVAGPCSWEYFAGFFDAEGYIHQQRGGVCLVLEIKQKYPRVLKCLREFLARSLGKDATLSKSGSMHVLWVCGMESCKQILQRLLAAGLLCKAEQARLVIGLTTQTAAQVNAELGSLTGNQHFGRSLDDAGRQRARKIAGVRHQARRLKQHGQFAEAEAKLGEVMQLKQKHELLKASHENQQLLEYVYKLQSLHQNSWEGPLARGM